MRARRFTTQGISVVEDFLTGVKEGTENSRPDALLHSEEITEPVPEGVYVDHRAFPNRLELARYLYEKLHVYRNAEQDRGLWTWLALFWFEQLCPPDSKGKRKPGELARWIPALDDARRYYRHLLLGPYLIYSAHRDDPSRAMALLCQPVHQPGELVEQLASRQLLITCRAVVGAATRLYYSHERGTLRKGVGVKGPGSARRLASVLMQFDLTFDLHALTPEQLIELLPAEFDAYRKKSG